MKLQNKIPLYVVIIILLVGIAGSFAIITIQRQASTEQFEDTASAISATIQNGLEQDMMVEDRSHIQQTLDDLKQNDAISGIDVVSPDGSIWASSNTQVIDTAADAATRDLLAGNAESQLISEFRDDHLTLIKPITAQDQCLQCHGTIAVSPNAQNYLGAIRVDISTTLLNETITTSQWVLVFVGIFTFILVTGTLVLMLRRSVLRPLAKLTGAASHISEGDYSTRVPVETPNNEIGAVSVAFNDMLSEVEHHTLQLKRANRELEQASRMKSEFLANMSHELRTPLNVIIGFSEVLKDTPPEQLEDSDRQEFCENIVASGYHLLELINDVLDLAKVEAGQMQFAPEEFYVGSALKEVIQTMQPLAAKKRLDLEIQISDRLTSVYADAGKFKQILYNLVGNAVKFTPEGGSIKVSASVMGKMARFTVSDTGVGISETDQKRVFSEFQQADGSISRQYEGTGLGLALTRKFVEMQGGQIWLESEVGTGSSFYFTLPLPRKAELPLVPPAARDLEGPGVIVDEAEGEFPAVVGEREMPNILVVEDDEATANLIGVWLSREGYNVDYAVDGVEALEKARQTRPFAVCLDIMLPKKDGWQVLHDLKRDPETADVGVIVCSALDNPELGFALGAADYCIKPLSRKHLLDKLRRLQRAVPGKRSQPQVLIADGDPDSAAATASILERQGFGVSRATNGKQAIDLALELSPDIAILDMMLAEVSCFDVISSLSEHPITTDLPIIVTTAKHLREKEKDFLEKNVQKVVVKGGNGRDQLMDELFRLEKLNPDRALMIDRETNLFNRRYFKKRLAEEVSRADRYSLDMSVLLIEMDEIGAQPHLKSDIVNNIAGILRSNVRAADPLARYDANRFAVLLPETHKDSGYAAAMKVVNLVRESKIVDEEGNQIKITVSVAVAGSPNGTISSDRLLAKLEQTLLSLRSAGGNMVKTVI